VSWTDWTSGDWLGKWVPQWTASPAQLPEAIAESVSRLVDVFGVSPAAVLHNIVSVASARLVGREIETVIGGQAVRAVLDELRVEPPQYGPLVGQFGAAKVEAHDVRWGDQRVDRVRIRAENMHLQPGVPSTLVAAPVRITAIIDRSELAAQMARIRPGLVLELGGGVATVAWQGREQWGHVEIVPEVHGDSLRLRPVAAVVRGHRIDAGFHLLPGIAFGLPVAPRGARCTDVAIDGDRLRLEVVIDEWREPLQPNQLQDFEQRVRRSTGATFRLARTPPESATTAPATAEAATTTRATGRSGGSRGPRQ
jgi:hypothetical protein